MIHIMDAFNAFKIYMGLKAHFNSDYDFTKYGGKTRACLLYTSDAADDS